MSDLSRHLPLRPPVFSALVALSGGPRTGVEILEHIDGAGIPILGPGTLYRLLRELREAGWIERVPPPAGEERSDERRQHHALTATGWGVVRLEAERLRRTLAGLPVEEGPEPAA